MRTDDVKRLQRMDRFLYWMDERHRIYLRRVAGDQKPWTDDEILREFYFTNVYRELDRTTQWFKRTVREPLQDSVEVIFATVCWRWFNLIETGEVLREHGWLREWDEAAVVAELGRRRTEGKPVFTGAYMINSPPGRPKLEAICARITNVWRDLYPLVRDAAGWATLQQAHNRLRAYDGMGGFMAYEIVCDLRHTAVLDRATDISTWANPGPGAVRGLYRVLGMPIPNKSNATAPPPPSDWTERMVDLLTAARVVLPSGFPLEMREIEQSLCEFDKYERLLWHEGKSKRRYAGGTLL